MDNVKHPQHYEGYLEDVDCGIALKSMMGNTKNYWWGCALKYIWRWPQKSGVEDLKKAKECIDRLIEEIDNGAQL